MAQIAVDRNGVAFAMPIPPQGGIQALRSARGAAATTPSASAFAATVGGQQNMANAAALSTEAQASQAEVPPALSTKPVP